MICSSTPACTEHMLFLSQTEHRLAMPSLKRPPIHLYTAAIKPSLPLMDGDSHVTMSQCISQYTSARRRRPVQNINRMVTFFHQLLLHLCLQYTQMGIPTLPTAGWILYYCCISEHSLLLTGMDRLLRSRRTQCPLFLDSDLSFFASQLSFSLTDLHVRESLAHLTDTV